MSEEIIQAQIDAINQKLDLILEEVYAQRESRQSLQDLADDAYIIGKDVFKNTVIQLDKAGVEVDPEALAGIGMKLIRNIGNINEFLEVLESVNDFLKDVSPIIHQVGLDAISKLNELEKRGYIDFFRELSRSLDNIVTHFKAEDVKALSDNIVFILETLRNLTQPDMLKAFNNALAIYKNLDMENVEEYSLFKAFMQFRKPEMKKGIGNPAMRLPGGARMPTWLGIIPGMEAMVSSMMKKQMDKLDVPPISEFIELFVAGGEGAQIIFT